MFNEKGLREDALLDAAMNHMVAFDASGVPQTLFSRIFGGVLVLRWIDLADAEQEAMAIFEERSYEPLLPSPLQWRRWAQLTDPIEMSDLMIELGLFVEDKRGDSANPVGAWLHLVVEPLIGARDLASGVFCRFVHWVADLPFETLAERRALRGVFDSVVSLTDSSPGEQYATPTNIANLIAALGNPRPGERVYDPCFGFGSLLLAAWEWASQASDEMRVSGPLLDITGIDINSSAFLIGITRMVLTGIEAPHLEIGNSLERESPSSPNRQGFDLAVANLPFGGFENAAPWIQRQYPFPTKHSTGLFIQHVLQQLRPSGRAVLVVPDGFLFRGGPDRELRARIVEEGQLEAVVSLPGGSFLPYTSIKCSLILLNKRGGNTSVRMVDAASQFEKRSGQKAPIIRRVLAEQLAIEVRRPELRKVRELPAGISEEATGTGKLARSIWESPVEEIALADWDLSARRREKGGLDDLLSSLREALGDSGTLAPLSELVQVIAGRAIKSGDLQDSPPEDGPVGYVRITDLSQGKVGRSSSWLAPDKAIVERRWSLLPGDVLVSKSGTIGKSAIVRNGAVGSVASSGLFVLRADQTRLDPGFLLGYLNSPACQNWLKAQSVGIVIQHLNRPVLDKLPVPLPPLQIQARAAAQFRDFGTDVLTFLSHALGAGESDRLSYWLAELSVKTPIGELTTDLSAPLAQLDQLAMHSLAPQMWLAEEKVGIESARWLAPLVETLSSLSGISQVPAGPGLLMILQEADRGFDSVIRIASGHFTTESQARSIAEGLREWTRSAIGDLLDNARLDIRSAPSSLGAGTFAEFAIELENDSPLPLRNLRVETKPDWGTGNVPYLAEHGTLALNLSGDVPKVGDQFSLSIAWSAINMNGQEVIGVFELALRVRVSEANSQITTPDLGGSPYVTGDPLQPQAGHSVFYGREGLIDQIKRQVATHGNVILLEGNRRSGKTSILHHLEGRAIPGWLAVYASLQGAQGDEQRVGVPTHEIFREMAGKIARAMNGISVEAPLPNGAMLPTGRPQLGVVGRACREGISVEAPFADFRDYLEEVLSRLAPVNLGLLLMLDEFDKLQEGIDSGVTSPQVPENIRYLIQTYPKFSTILTGSRRLKRLREEHWSALYGLGINIIVSALDYESARRVVTEPVSDRLVYSNEALDRVVHLTAQHPYLIQLLCNAIFEYAAQTKSRSITLGIVNDVAGTLARSNEHFTDLWVYAGLGPSSGRKRRQLILLLFARALKQDVRIRFSSLLEQLAQSGVEAEDESLAADLAYLRELELIQLSGEIGDGQYSLTVPLMAEWIEQQHDADVVISRARAEAEEEHD